MSDVVPLAARTPQEIVPERNFMHPLDEVLHRTRRDFLTSTSSGLGLLGLGALLTQEGIVSQASAATAPHAATESGLIGPRSPHFPPRAKSCIFIFMEGAPSQHDLFYSKPKLNEMHGKPMPASILDKVRFAFIKKESAVLLGTKRKFSRHGECGMEFSDLLPHVSTLADDLVMIRSLHSDQFNHHPGQLLMQCGRAAFGLPSVGSWLNYGLGSPSRNLPGYAVLACGRGGGGGGATLWSSGFLPSSYAGVLFGGGETPILNLKNPPGLPAEMQRQSLDTLGALNRNRFSVMGDPEISSRIENYELAFRMQTAAPELIDLSSETKATLRMYGVGRPEPHGDGGRGKFGLTYDDFARNCLLARRLVERGVRFVNVMHSSWDHHSGLDKELPYNAGMADQPVAALLKDLKQRGLLNETLVVWGSEFGRTPLAENGDLPTIRNPGRDHHPFSFTMLAAGGGLKGGLIWGETDDVGWGVTKDPVHVNDFHATLLHLFGLNHLRLTHRFQGRDFRLTDVGGKVIREWLA